MANVDFKPDIGGIRSILKSGPVAAELGKIAGRTTTTANRIAAGYGRSGVYRTYVDQGRYTAIGKTIMADKWVGGYLEAKHHVLTSLNH